MFCTDFIFDGESLSDYGFIICNFDGGEQTVSGGDVTLYTSKPPSSNKHTFFGSGREEPLVFNFSIGKNTCSGDYKDDYLTQDDQSAITRWLKRTDGYHWLSYCQDGWEDVWFNSQINLQPIFQKGRHVGYDVIVNTDSPYGYGQEINKSFTLNSNEEFTIIDYSDVVGSLYPYIKLTTLSSGGIKLQSGCSANQVLTTIDNVAEGDEIVLDGNSDLILGVNNLNNFNYVFPILSNSYTNPKKVSDFRSDLGRQNNITNIGDVDINIEMKYRYIKEVTI